MKGLAFALLLAGCGPLAPGGNSHDDANDLHLVVNDRAKVEALLTAGADPNAADKVGITPLMIAAARDDGGPVVALLLAHGADAEPAIAYAGGGDSASLRALLDHGAKPNKTGFTPLHGAAIWGSLANAQLLLERGADVNALDGMGRTPLMWAAQMGHDDVVALLVAHGADPNIVEPFSGTTALMQAVSSDRAGPAIVASLLKAKADVTPRDHEGASALTWAVRRADPSIVAALRARDTTPPTPVWTADGERVGAANTTPAALALAVPLLEKARPAFRQKSGCPSCHHDVLPAMAISRAAAQGVSIDANARVTEAHDTVRSMRPNLARYREGTGFADLAEPAYLLVGLAASGYPPDDVTDAMARYVALRQTKDGAWRTQMQRVPMDGSDVSFTAFAIRALDVYDRGSDGKERISRARAWLASVDARTNEDLTFKALGLSWAKASAAEIAPTIAALAARQREDGGFAQRDGLGSDAYATGQAVIALRDAGGLPADAPAIRRAVRFLLADQMKDGSWFVATRALPFQPWFESGFPQGRSQYISVAATAWAVMALVAAER